MVAITVSFVPVLTTAREVLLAAPARCCPPHSGAWPFLVTAIAIVRLAGRTPIGRTLLVAVAFSWDRAADQALDVAQLAYFLPIAQRNGDASSAGARGAADPMQAF